MQIYLILLDKSHGKIALEKSHMKKLVCSILMGFKVIGGETRINF